MSETILSPTRGTALSSIRRRVIVRLFDQLEACGATAVDLRSLPPDIAELIPGFLKDFDRLRALVESDLQASSVASTLPLV